MNRSSLPRLGRMAALALLVCGVLLLGANSAAWATPARAPAGQTVPTRTPAQSPGPRLNLSQIRCSGQNVQVDFVVVQLPADVTDYGTVSYVVNGQTRTAAFSKRTGDVAHYLDSIPPAAQAPDGGYDITAATVTLVAAGGQLTVTLENPNEFTVICKTSKPPKSPKSGDTSCPDGSDRENVGPGAARTISNCPWWINVDADDFSADGAISIALVAPGAAPPPNGGEIFVGRQIEITLFDKDGKPVMRPTFGSTIELCYNYSAEDVARAGGTTNFSIQTYDTAASQWVVLSTTLDSANGIICAELPHLSMFGLAAKTGAPAAPEAVAAPIPPVAGVAPAVVPSMLPNTGAGAGEVIPVWIWIMIGMAFGMAGALIAWRRLRQ
jgi:hypothetical protein